MAAPPLARARIRMLIVEMIAKTRRAFFVQGNPIKAICRELRASQNVVWNGNILRSEAIGFRYEREAQLLPKIGLSGGTNSINCYWQIGDGVA
jgi:hypothetical protein